MRGQLIYTVEVEDQAELNRVRHVGHDALHVEGVRVRASSALLTPEPDEDAHGQAS